MIEPSTQAWSYWAELRQRILYCLYCLSGAFLVCYHYANPIFHQIARPVLTHPGSKKIVVLSLTDSIITPLKLSWYCSLTLSIPFLFYQLWRFLAPALYTKERSVFLRLLIGSTGLFYCGMLFCIYIIMPFIVSYLIGLMPSDVDYLPDMRQYFEFVSTLSLSFGIIFELPLVMVLGHKIGWISYEQLKEFRRYFVVIAFFIGMILTPPDVISQCLLAIPICLLYEVGMLSIKITTRHKKPSHHISPITKQD